MKRLRVIVIALMASTCVAATTVPSLANPRGDVAAARALPLVMERTTLQLHSLGTDRFDVWLCDVPKNTSATEWADLPGRIDTTARGVASRIRAFAPGYFAWLSNGRYKLDLRARGALRLRSGEDFKQCGAKAMARSAGRDGVIVVSDVRGDTHAVASADECQEDTSVTDPCAGKPTTLPGSKRAVFLGAMTLFPSASNSRTGRQWCTRSAIR